MRIGMVGTRFAGLDGVSLESAKIARLAERAGHAVFWFAGERSGDFEPGVTVPTAHFADASELARQAEYFGVSTARGDLQQEVRAAAAELHRSLEQFVAEFAIDVLLPQNALSIPMQLPLAIAITDLIGAGTPAVAHHHDFAWERDRFAITSVPDMIAQYFPPSVSGLEHWVINSIARDELQARKGVAATVVPNVMDFSRAPDDAKPEVFRDAAGIDPGVRVILQPTRVIRRKSIETTIDLAAAVRLPCVVVVTHDEGDEGDGYGDRLRAHAAASGVDLRFVPADGQNEGPQLADAYAAADLVSFPSVIEGFGNALLEAFYHRRPVLVRRYPVYVSDIAPTGVQCIEIDDDLTPSSTERAARWLAEPDLWAEAVEVNFAVGSRHFSFEAIEQRVADSLARAAAGR